MRSGLPLVNSSLALLIRSIEAVQHAEHCDEGGDRGADSDRGQNGSAWRPQHVANRHLSHRRTRQSDVAGPTGEPAGLGGEVAGSDGLDWFDPQRPPHRERAGRDRNHDPECCGLGVDAELERCAVFGERPDRLEEVPERVTHDEPDPETGDGAKDCDLCADHERPDRELSSWHAQGHSDTDLSALGFDDSTDQIECREGGSSQHECGQCIPELLVVVDVLVQHAHRVRVVAGGHDAAQTQIGDHRRELGFNHVTVCAIGKREDDVVHHSRMTADVLRRCQRQVQDGEFAFSGDRSFWAFVEEVLRSGTEPGIGHGPSAGNHDRSLGRKPAMVSELGFHHRRAELRLIVDWCRSVADPDAVDGLREPERHPDKTGRNQHRIGPADRTGVDLAVHDKTFDNGSHRGCSIESPDGFDQSTLLGEGPGAERDTKIVHRQAPRSWRHWTAAATRRCFPTLRTPRYQSPTPER